MPLVVLSAVVVAVAQVIIVDEFSTGVVKEFFVKLVMGDSRDEGDMDAVLPCFVSAQFNGWFSNDGHELVWSDACTWGVVGNGFIDDGCHHRVEWALVLKRTILGEKDGESKRWGVVRDVLFENFAWLQLLEGLCGWFLCLCSTGWRSVVLSG